MLLEVMDRAIRSRKDKSQLHQTQQQNKHKHVDQFAKHAIAHRELAHGRCRLT